MKVIMIVEKDNKRFGYALGLKTGRAFKALLEALEGCKIISLKVK